MRQNIIPIMPIVENPTKVRVAAYVRVSTSKDDQLNSFAAQYIHYKKLFEDSTYEELIDVYSDEGISGTTTDKRDGFNRIPGKLIPRQKIVVFDLTSATVIPSNNNTSTISYIRDER